MIAVPDHETHPSPALLVAACGCRRRRRARLVNRPRPTIATQVQARYDRIRDFSADFTQEADSGVLRKKLVERGIVQVKKPGKMRWDYKAPEKKIFVSDGLEIYCTSRPTSRSSSAPCRRTTRRRPRCCSWPARAT